eukprot:1596484-Prymnesium_polylepis.1
MRVCDVLAELPRVHECRALRRVGTAASPRLALLGHLGSGGERGGVAGERENGRGETDKYGQGK